MILHSLPFNKVLFLDIETVPQVYHHDDLDDRTQMLWANKVQHRLTEGTTPKDLYKKAGILAEFGRIVCISTGYLLKKEGAWQLRLKSFSGKDERQLLQQFSDLLNQHFNTSRHLLCAHNGKEFDFPYLSRRMLIHGLPLPKLLNLAGKKPWQVPHLDTMELWKFGDWKSYTSLDLLAHVFDIPTPKDDLTGADVARVFWEEDDLPRIEHYCRKDVTTLTKLLLKMAGQPGLHSEVVVE